MPDGIPSCSHLGVLLRTYRTRVGCSQSGALRLVRAEHPSWRLTVGMIGHWEAGRRTPAPSRLGALATAYRVTDAELAQMVRLAARHALSYRLIRAVLLDTPNATDADVLGTWHVVLATRRALNPDPKITFERYAAPDPDDPSWRLREFAEGDPWAPNPQQQQKN